MKPTPPALKKIMHSKVLIAVAIASVAMVVGLLWIGSPAAEDAGAVPEAGDPAPTSSIGTGGMALRVIGSVVLVIAVLYAGMFAMKVLSHRATGGNLKKDAISVLQRRYIAPKKAIYVVKVGTRAMVVGVTDAQINHLADLSTDELETIKATEPEKAGQFKQHLLAFGFGVKNKG
jgi:flagellar biogenesis protein FliO